MYWSIMDGADYNRQFIRMHFRGRDPVKDKFITSNIHTETPMVFVMDPKVDLGTKFIPLQRYSNNLYFTISQSQFQPERTNLGYVYSRTKWLQSE